MSSGIPVSDKCVDAYQALSKRTYSAVVMKIAGTKEDMHVGIVKTLPPSSGDPEAEWKEVMGAMPDEECRYIITDFQVKETPTVTKSKIILILWSPEYAPVKDKMMHASSMETVTQKMAVQKTIQANDKDDVEYKAIKGQIAK